MAEVHHASVPKVHGTGAVQEGDKKSRKLTLSGCSQAFVNVTPIRILPVGLQTIYPSG